MKKMLKDMLKYVSARVPAALAATANATGVDLQDFNACTFLVHVGASGANFTANDGFNLVLQESDTDVDGDYTNCAPESIFANGAAGGEAATTDGIAKKLDAVGDASAVHAVHYRGEKRYSRVRFVLVGTNSAPIGVLAVLGHSEAKPPL